MPVAFHIKDPATDAAVRRLAAERGISLTAAVREAVENELKRSRRPLKERVDELAKEYRSYPLSGLKADKAFFDDLSGDT
jgi:antitoxin VapB